MADRITAALMGQEQPVMRAAPARSWYDPLRRMFSSVAENGLEPTLRQGANSLRDRVIFPAATAFGNVAGDVGSIPINMAGVAGGAATGALGEATGWGGLRQSGDTMMGASAQDLNANLVDLIRPFMGKMMRGPSGEAATHLAAVRNEAGPTSWATRGSQLASGISDAAATTAAFPLPTAKPTAVSLEKALGTWRKYPNATYQPGGMPENLVPGLHPFVRAEPKYVPKEGVTANDIRNAIKQNPRTQQWHDVVDNIDDRELLKYGMAEGSDDSVREVVRPFYDDVASNTPRTFYHKTGSPVFSAREFAPDPGTKNWLGKGTYSSMRGNEVGYADTKLAPEVMVPRKAPFVERKGKEAEEVIKRYNNAVAEWNSTPHPVVDDALMERFGRIAEGTEFAKTPIEKQLAMGLISVDEAAQIAVRPLRPIRPIVNLERADLTAHDILSQVAAGGDPAYIPGQGYEYNPPNIEKHLGDLYSPVETAQPAPRTMMLSANVRKPFIFEEKPTAEDLKAALSGVPRQERRQIIGALKDMKRGQPDPESLVWVPKNDDIDAMRRTLEEVYRKMGITREVAAWNDAEVLTAVQRMMGRNPNHPELSKVMEQIGTPTYRGGKPLQKGHVWAAVAGTRPGGYGGPDAVSDALRARGYDAIGHYASPQNYGLDLLLSGGELSPGWRAPSIDSHSEISVFDPKNIYEPFLSETPSRMNTFLNNRRPGIGMGRLRPIPTAATLNAALQGRRQ